MKIKQEINELERELEAKGKMVNEPPKQKIV